MLIQLMYLFYYLFIIQWMWLTRLLLFHDWYFSVNEANYYQNLLKVICILLRIQDRESFLIHDSFYHGNSRLFSRTAQKLGVFLYHLQTSLSFFTGSFLAESSFRRIENFCYLPRLVVSRREIFCGALLVRRNPWGGREAKVSSRWWGF